MKIKDNIGIGSLKSLRFITYSTSVYTNVHISVPNVLYINAISLVILSKFFVISHEGLIITTGGLFRKCDYYFNF